MHVDSHLTHSVLLLLLTSVITIRAYLGFVTRRAISERLSEFERRLDQIFQRLPDQRPMDTRKQVEKELKRFAQRLPDLLRYLGNNGQG